MNSLLAAAHLGSGIAYTNAVMDWIPDTSSKQAAPVVKKFEDPREEMRRRDHEILLRNLNRYSSNQSNSSNNENEKERKKKETEELFLARVLYSETSSKASLDEFKKVCKVIMNRINNKDFGGGKKPTTAYEVVIVKNAFSCINDPNNSNWTDFTPTLNKYTKRACKYAKAMMNGQESTLNLPDDSSIVYYHDKSIKCPAEWTNKYWKPKLVETTTNFKFYKVIPNK